MWWDYRLTICVALLHCIIRLHHHHCCCCLPCIFCLLYLSSRSGEEPFCFFERLPRFILGVFIHESVVVSYLLFWWVFNNKAKVYVYAAEVLRGRESGRKKAERKDSINLGENAISLFKRIYIAMCNRSNNCLLACQLCF